MITGHLQIEHMIVNKELNKFQLDLISGCPFNAVMVNLRFYGRGIASVTVHYKMHIYLSGGTFNIIRKLFIGPTFFFQHFLSITPGYSY